jgi:hypothetical protein
LGLYYVQDAIAVPNRRHRAQTGALIEVPNGRTPIPHAGSLNRDQEQIELVVLVAADARAVAGDVYPKLVARKTQRDELALLLADAAAPRGGQPISHSCGRC